ncbi:hypothetical protein [uncultured Lamprocystis sp.]|jgi:hypothetical protein|uniref:hypothetical protein n=1 Tax=uncultured Lamprocystis sp. TaxID=543132 RepID=UPI0025F7F9AA|nr:hypothetical protein [uncultured Lamprocystis sp.]
MAKVEFIKQTDTAKKSLQYELFTTFFGDAAELSNTIELWDAIPKYAISPRTQNALRSPDSRLPVHEYSFVYATRRGGQRIESACRVAIQPASIKSEDGYIDFYPSTNEELVEEVIRKIFADQQCGLHDPNNAESWVRFSVQMIRKELKARGKTRNLDEIKRSIDILSRTHISLFVDDTDDPVYSAPILSDVTRVTRQNYLTDTSITWVARLPALISKSVNELTYRQFNYGVLMSLSSQIARWLHKRLSHNYTNASFMDPYEILFSSIQRDSGFMTYARTNDNLQALEAAFAELQSSRILNAWTRVEKRREGRKILDIKYSLHAHSDFIKDVKAANARLKDSRSTFAGVSVHNFLPGGR